MCNKIGPFIKKQLIIVRDLWRNPILLLGIIGILIPAILLALYIKNFGVNLVFWDQWIMVPLLDKFYTGHLTFGDLFAQHNEHRIFFSEVIIIAMAYFTHYNTVDEMFLAVLILLGVLLMIFSMYVRRVGINAMTVLAFIPVSWLLFTWIQCDNYLFGTGLGAFLCVLGFVASIYFLDRINLLDYKIVLAIAFAFFSSFSLGNGLLVWPVGAIFILISGIKDKFKAFALWSASAIVAVFAYFYKWALPSGHQSIFSTNDILTPVEYFVTNVGLPISYEINYAIVAGIILISLAALSLYLILKHKCFSDNAPWIALALFSLGSTTIYTIGRSGFGVQQALSSRYATFTIFLAIGVYLIFLYLINRYRDDRLCFVLFGAILTIMLIGIFIGYQYGLSAGETIKESRLQMANDLINYNVSSNDSLEKIYPDASFVRENVKILEKYHLSLFYK